MRDKHELSYLHERIFTNVTFSFIYLFFFSFYSFNRIISPAVSPAPRSTRAFVIPFSSPRLFFLSSFISARSHFRNLSNRSGIKFSRNEMKLRRSSRLQKSRQILGEGVEKIVARQQYASGITILPRRYFSTLDPFSFLTN